MASCSDELGGNAQECYDRGVQLLQGGDIRKAILQFQQATFFDGDNANPLAALAECHVFLSDLPSAVRYYRRAMWALTRRRRAQQRAYEREHGPMLMLVGRETNANALYCVAPPRTPSLSTSVAPTPQAASTTAAASEDIVADETICVPGPGSNGRTKAADFADDSGVPILAVQRRLAALLDALGLSLFRLANYDQALRFALEALEVLGERLDMRVEKRPASGASSHDGEDGAPQPFPPHDKKATISSSSSTMPNVAPTVQLHRCTYLIAMQRSEDAEYALEAFLEKYTVHHAEAGALLVQLYCNRQAFSAARKMVENLESDCVSVSAQKQSLKIAKHIFNKQYARYRGKALERRDLGTISKCIDVYPNDVDLLFTRATLFIERGEQKKSVRDLFQCVRETNGQHRGAIDAMTSVLFSLGTELGEGGQSSLEEAIAYYTESLKWRPDNRLVILARADCYVKLEDYEQALAGYRLLLEMNADDKEAKERIAFLHDRWGRKLHTLGKVREAEQEFTMAIKSSSAEPLFYYHRALCRFALGESRYGLRDVLSCQQLQPADPRIRAFIVRYLGTDEVPSTSLEAKEAESRALIQFNSAGDATLLGSDATPRSYAVSATRAAALYGQPSARLQGALAQDDRDRRQPSSSSARVRGEGTRGGGGGRTRTAPTATPPPPTLRTYKDLVIAQNQTDSDPHADARGKTSDELRYKFTPSRKAPTHAQTVDAPFVMVQGARTNIHQRELVTLAPLQASGRVKTAQKSPPPRLA